MTWVKLDDGFMRNRKVRALSHKALALHISGLCHCAAQLTDGRIDRPDVPLLLAEARVTKAALVELTSVGVWREHKDHFQIHDYLEYQESRASVLDRREKWAKKKQSQRMSPRDTEGDSNGESHAPVPSRPVLPTSSSSTTHHHPDGGDDDDERFRIVLDRLVSERIRKFPAKTNALNYRTKVTNSILTEHGETIRLCLQARPDHPADTVAELLALDIA